MAVYIMLFACGFEFAPTYTLYNTMSIQLPIVPGTEGNNVVPPEMIKPEDENEITEDDAVIDEDDRLEENLTPEEESIPDENSIPEKDTNSHDDTTVNENTTNNNANGIDVDNVINYDKMIQNRKIMMLIGIVGLATFSLFTLIGAVGGR